jgi:hypothetical protein
MMVFFEGVKITTFKVVILNKCGEKMWYATFWRLQNEIFIKYNLKRWFSSVLPPKKLTMYREIR